MGLLSLIFQPFLHTSAPKLLSVTPDVSHLLTFTGAVVTAWNILFLSLPGNYKPSQPLYIFAGSNYILILRVSSVPSTGPDTWLTLIKNLLKERRKVERAEGK